MLLAGVIRSEDALAFLAREPNAGVGDFDDHLPSWRLVRRVSVPPFGIASIALSTRFDSARCNKFRIGGDGPEIAQSNSKWHVIGARPGACSCA